MLQTNSYPVIVPYRGTMTIGGLIERGRYDWAHPDITDANFPHAQEDSVRTAIELVDLGLDISTDDALAALRARHLRPVHTAELLALGAEHPELQRMHPLAALGRNLHRPSGRSYAVCLIMLGVRRRVTLGWTGFTWRRNYRFPAVPE